MSNACKNVRLGCQQEGPGIKARPCAIYYDYSGYAIIDSAYYIYVISQEIIKNYV